MKYMFPDFSYILHLIQFKEYKVLGEKLESSIKTSTPTLVYTDPKVEIFLKWPQQNSLTNALLFS